MLLARHRQRQAAWVGGGPAITGIALPLELQEELQVKVEALRRQSFERRMLRVVQLAPLGVVAWFNDNSNHLLRRIGGHEAQDLRLGPRMACFDASWGGPIEVSNLHHVHTRGILHGILLELLEGPDVVYCIVADLAEAAKGEGEGV